MTTKVLIRSYQPKRDLPGLVVLYNAVHTSAYNAKQIQSMIAWPGHDPARDRWVAEAEDQLVGQSWLYAQSPARSFVEVDVHPAWRRLGIGRSLLEGAIRVAHERGAEQVTTAAPARERGARVFLQAAGFREAGHVRFFSAPATLVLPHVDPDEPPPPPLLPDGFRIRSGDSFDLQIFADACNRCYADMWGHYENLQPLTVEKIEEWRRRSPERFRLDGVFVLFGPRGEPVGVTRAMTEGEGRTLKRVIDAPGVAPEYRSLGLQRALVQTAAGWLRQNTPHAPYEIQTWGDTDEAAAIYGALGFRMNEDNHSVEYVRSLAESA